MGCARFIGFAKCGKRFWQGESEDRVQGSFKEIVLLMTVI